ncbi:histidinol-phosphate transaminase [Candidatus Bathyarchaeota archaeon]|nr:histidinol-phosphate transaminase [Candidatus Bathyarchaeota archaeon]
MSEPKKETIKQLFDEAQGLGVYEVGETISGLARKLGRRPEEIIKLNSNENFFVSLDFLRNVLKESVDEIDPRIYPRDECIELKQALAKYLSVVPEQIVIGTGSDDLINLIARMMLKKGDEALSISPTFSIYERCVRTVGAYYKAVPLKEDFSLDTDNLLKNVSSRTKLIFLCSPNNPTANKFQRQDVEALANNFDGVVAVDEAYVDFSDGSFVDIVNKYENLVVFRTFSKVFGLAGLRIGCAISNSMFAKIMDEKFQMPYTVTLVTIKTAIKILENKGIIKEVIEKIKVQRQILIEDLNKIRGVQAFDSETNFVLFQTSKSSKIVYEKLLGKGIIVRDIGQVLRYPNCLRVTVAPQPMMDRFLRALKEILS